MAYTALAAPLNAHANGLQTCIHTYTIATCIYIYLVLADFDVRTSPEELTPLLVAASYNRKNAVLWLLQDAEHKIKKDAVDSDGRNAIHLASLDLQCQYTIEVSSYLLLSHMYVRVQPLQVYC